jgi:fructokinase
VIVVAGEALVDLVIQPHGAVTAALGGGPYNAARTCGRLGVDVAFLGALSSDRFGAQLAAALTECGVDLSLAPRLDAPTTLAAAEIDERGAATYRFYLDGTSAPALVVAPALPVATTALQVGTLGLVVEPMASTLEAVVDVVPPDVLVMLDPNCRPLVIADRNGYVARLQRVLQRADVVKVSDDDLAFLAPGRRSLDAAVDLLATGPRVVLLTAGADGTFVVTAAGVAHVPAEPVAVVDTIGAGDSFGGGFLAWWARRGLGRRQLDDDALVRAATAAATRVAGITCSRRGADPPWRHELAADWDG